MDKTSLEDARKLAKDILGDTFEQVEKGRNNWVFNVGNRILVIPRHERVKNYSVRVAAIKTLASNGIPTPIILDYSPATNKSPEYLITKKIDGVNINLSELTPPERNQVHYSSGEILAKINSIPTQSYGRFNEAFLTELTSWRQFTDDFFEESLHRLKKTSFLWNKYAKLLIGEYEKGGPLIDNFRTPHFLHSDFHLNNLLFKDLKVVAVLDTDMVTSGDPSWDSGHYCHTFNVDRVAGVESFKEGYKVPTDIEKERLYCLMIWTKKIASQALNRPEALKETLPELEKIIRGKI
jgi:aminoglycoside phosphotransferase (APT) family kinase protein